MSTTPKVTSSSTASAACGASTSATAATKWPRPWPIRRGAFGLEGLGLRDSKVITIDIQNLTEEVSALPLWRKRVLFIHSSSTDPRAVATVSEQVRGKKVLVILDSDHSKSHVLAELKAYAPLVSPDSYVIVEDTVLDAIPLSLRLANDGPMAAVEEFLASEAGAAFSPDAAREALVVTFHPGGWLRRIP